MPAKNPERNLTGNRYTDNRYTDNRTKSEEPSLSLAPARYGSVGRDEGFQYPTRNWRSKLREQQLADNRQETYLIYREVIY